MSEPAQKKTKVVAPASAQRRGSARAAAARRYTKTERSHEENQERAYIAASRRSDRSLEARMESARRASEIHKQRVGRGFKITEKAVMNEEMYEEEDPDYDQRVRRLMNVFNNPSYIGHQPLLAHQQSPVTSPSFPGHQFSMHQQQAPSNFYFINTATSHTSDPQLVSPQTMSPTMQIPLSPIPQTQKPQNELRIEMPPPLPQYQIAQLPMTPSQMTPHSPSVQKSSQMQPQSPLVQTPSQVPQSPYPQSPYPQISLSQDQQQQQMMNFEFPATESMMESTLLPMQSTHQLFEDMFNLPDDGPIQDDFERFFT